MAIFRRFAGFIVGNAIVLFARFLTAVRGLWLGIEPVPAKRVYFANHTSNADFVLIWTALPPRMRRQTRPVAAADYWFKSKLRGFVITDVFNAVTIDRRADVRTDDPMAKMVAALDEDASLIIFPEGRRNEGPDALLPFKTGLFHLATHRPDVDLVPVWLENLNSVMPRGEVIPIPLICTVTFGAPLHLQPDEERDVFLSRASEALLALKPGSEAEA
ncbi:lysophospholipid acyltransferase family protein [Algirhabdus cladophorae]|uniref:lysophospholipid acyltransferase family protein n=1 Tax=Algirhabdus cladophorae TaxID=3377108 RepID=UPI003B845395